MPALMGARVPMHHRSRMGPPPPPLLLLAVDCTLETKSGKKKQILKTCSGVAKAGRCGQGGGRW